MEKVTVWSFPDLKQRNSGGAFSTKNAMFGINKIKLRLAAQNKEYPGSNE